MFAKLLKYDMKSAFRVWWIIAAVLGGVTAASAFALRFCMQYAERDAYIEFPIHSTLAFMIAFGYILLVSFSTYGILIPIYIRFYKHLYTDEGYLTFTLPVKRSTILLSKTINNFIFTVIHLVFLFLCIMFMALIIPTPEKGGAFINPVVFEELGKGINAMWSDIGLLLVVYITETILIYAASIFFSISMIQFCITVGSVVAKKHKVLAAVGIYFGTNFILSTISQFISIFVQLFVTGGTIEILSGLSDKAILAVVAVVLLGVFAATLTVALAFYFTTRNTLERKLNLA